MNQFKPDSWRSCKMKLYVLQTFLFAGFFAHVSPQICTASCSTQRKDIAFLVDESASINNGQLNFQRNFLNSLLDCWTINSNAVQVSLVTFSVAGINRFGLTQFNNDREGAKTFISNFVRSPQNLATNTQLGILEVMNSIFTGTGGDRPDAPNCLILFTDGDSGSPQTITNKQALLPSLADCFVVGIGDLVNINEIDALASKPLIDHKFLVDRYSNLPLIMPQLQEVPCPACNPVCMNESPCNRSANACDCGEIFTGDRCELCRF